LHNAKYYGKKKPSRSWKAYIYWLQDTLAKTAPGGASAKAIAYALKRWSALIRYADTGHLPIDNNPTENCIRPIALGRNYVQFDIMHSSPVTILKAA
jgi:hypothetical protein